MKRLFLTLLSTGAVCAVLSATPVAAQETITGAPPGQAPVTAEPPPTPGDYHIQMPSMQASDSTQGHAGCAVLENSRAEGGHAELTAVCPFIP
ncbi:MAG: hypothetical protein WB766_13420 [Roseiarcus sp.]